MAKYLVASGGTREKPVIAYQTDSLEEAFLYWLKNCRQFSSHRRGAVRVQQTMDRLWLKEYPNSKVPDVWAVLEKIYG